MDDSLPLLSPRHVDPRSRQTHFLFVSSTCPIKVLAEACLYTPGLCQLPHVAVIMPCATGRAALCPTQHSLPRCQKWCGAHRQRYPNPTLGIIRRELLIIPPSTPCQQIKDGITQTELRGQEEQQKKQMASSNPKAFPRTAKSTWVACMSMRVHACAPSITRLRAAESNPSAARRAVHQMKALAFHTRLCTGVPTTTTTTTATTAACLPPSTC